MDALNPALVHLSSIAAQGLVTAIWESAVLVLVVAACLRLLPGLSASARSIIWTATFLVTALLPAFAVRSFGAGVAQADHEAKLHLGSEWGFALIGIWAALSLLRSVQLLRSAFHLRGVAMRAVPLASPELTTILDPDVEAKVSRPVELCSSTEVDAPCVVGFFHPRILVPAVMLATISPTDLRQIVLHEMEHLRRKDDWTNLLQKLGVVLLPIHPVLLWIERRLCAERELACDDGVLRATGSRKAYATCLVNLAEQSLMRRSLSLALGAWHQQSELARRVHRILRGPERQMGRRRSAAIIGLALASIVGAAAVMTRVPQLITFTGESVSAQAKASTGDIVIAPSMRVGTIAHPTLVSAHISEDRVKRVTAKEQFSPRRSATFATAKTKRRGGGSTDSITLIRWETMGRTIQMVPTAEEDSHFIYAAVPTRNGWLVVKL